MSFHNSMQMEPQFSNQVISIANNQLLKILIVEDEVLFARAVMRRLQKAGFECEHAENIQDARQIAKQFLPDIALLDMRLPDGNGMDLLPELVAKNITCVVMTAHGDISDAVSAMKLGALDYLKKPIDLEELLIAINKAQNTIQQNNQIDYAKQRNTHTAETVEFFGESTSIKNIKSQIQRIAQLVASDVVPPTVLIHGETGTGKDVAARLLHALCPNNDRPFVHVDCASLPAELIESELFGHEKGAFTGAVATRPGLIEAAEDGVLFLDEIGELPLSLQAKLLNVLERRIVRRIGSTKERPVPARIIAATNRDLQEMAVKGSFREDLYYRLNVMSIILPPLRQREGDAFLLAQYFAGQTARRYALEKPVFSSDAIRMINEYTWPGNVRELKHQISRAMLLCSEGHITAQDLALSVQSRYVMQESPAPSNFSVNHSMSMTLDEAEKNLLLQTLTETRNNVSEAARKLGITRMTMRYRMAKHQIEV